MTALGWIAYILFVLTIASFSIYGWAGYATYCRRHNAMLRRLDSHPREAVRNPEDAWRRVGGL